MFSVFGTAILRAKQYCGHVCCSFVSKNLGRRYRWLYTSRSEHQSDLRCYIQRHESDAYENAMERTRYRSIWIFNIEHREFIVFTPVNVYLYSQRSFNLLYMSSRVFISNRPRYQWCTETVYKCTVQYLHITDIYSSTTRKWAIALLLLLLIQCHVKSRFKLSRLSEYRHSHSSTVN